MPPEAASELAGLYRELALRTELAHEEAFVQLGTGQTTRTEWQMIADALHGWAAERGRRPSQLGARVTLMVVPPRNATSEPDRDFAVPWRE